MFEELKKYLQDKELEVLGRCGLSKGYTDDDSYYFYVASQEAGNAGDTYYMGSNMGELTAYEGILSKIEELEC